MPPFFLKRKPFYYASKKNNFSQELQFKEGAQSCVIPKRQYQWWLLHEKLWYQSAIVQCRRVQICYTMLSMHNINKLLYPIHSLFSFVLPPWWLSNIWLHWIIEAPRVLLIWNPESILTSFKGIVEHCENMLFQRHSS